MPDSNKIAKEKSEAISVEPEKVSAEIAVQKAIQGHRILLITLAFTWSFFGGLGFVLEVGLLGFPISNLAVFLTLWLPFPILITGISLYRNRILKNIFNAVSSYTYLKFSRFWQLYNNIILTATILSIVLGFAFPNNLGIKLLPLPIFVLFMPFRYIFELSLTYEGEVRILFENLLLSINLFSERNIFWKQIAEKIRLLLERGNIEISKDDLIYHFNAKLWETKDDVTAQLKDIEAWLLDRKTSCFDSITQIIPKDCFKAGKSRNFLRNIVANPTAEQVDIIKVLGPVTIVIIFAILILIHPELGSQIISHLP
jgi:hypothetical protein